MCSITSSKPIDVKSSFGPPLAILMVLLMGQQGILKCPISVSHFSFHLAPGIAHMVEDKLIECFLNEKKYLPLKVDSTSLQIRRQLVSKEKKNFFFLFTKWEK